MDHNTVACAFRLSSILQSRHPLSRGLDANTRIQVELVTQSAVRPPSLSSFDDTKYTKLHLADDLEYFARAMVDQALRSQATLLDIKKAVKEAITETTSPPPIPPTLEEIRSLIPPQAPTIGEIRSAVNSISDILPFSSSEDICLHCHRYNKQCELWKKGRPMHERHYF
jgi:hypothetical protein